MSSTRSELLTQELMEALKTLQKRVEILKPKEDSEESGSSESKTEQKSEECSKNKWKDALVNFSHTLNLLIGMCENALLNAKDSENNDKDKDEKSQATEQKETNE